MSRWNGIAACWSMGGFTGPLHHTSECARYNEYAPSSMAPVLLTSIFLNAGQGATAYVGQPVTMSVVYTPPTTTDKSLTWKVCTAQPSACRPDTTGHCRVCTAAADREA